MLEKRRISVVEIGNGFRVLDTGRTAMNDSLNEE